MEDPYKILGVSPDATDDEVKKAYRQLAKKYHPDVNKEAGAEERFKRIQNAYDTIMNMRKNGGNAREFWNQYGSQQTYANNDYQNVVAYLNLGQYVYAYQLLSNMSNRDATWYYLYAIANYGLGQQIAAMEAAERACQMDPTNNEYRQLYAQIQQGQNRYRRMQQPFGDGSSLCCQLILCNMCLGGFGMPLFCCCQFMEELIQTIVNKYAAILKDNLTGIYIHGSYAMGCFNPSKSDLDFLVICERMPTFNQKKRMIQFLMKLEPKAPAKGFEMSLVLKRYCMYFTYPTPYELHYSPMYRSSFKEDLEGTVLKMHGKDRDLAAHFMVAFHSGICAYGADIKKIFLEVPKEAYLNSIENDIADSKKRLEEEPVDVILNLCRVYYYKKEGVVSSKLSAGKWAVKNFPHPFDDIVSRACICYQSDAEYKFHDKKGKLFLDFMKKEGILNEKK